MKLRSMINPEFFCETLDERSALVAAATGLGFSVHTGASIIATIHGEITLDDYVTIMQEMKAILD